MISPQRAASTMVLGDHTHHPEHGSSERHSIQRCAALVLRQLVHIVLKHVTQRCSACTSPLQHQASHQQWLLDKSGFTQREAVLTWRAVAVGEHVCCHAIACWEGLPKVL